MKNFVQPGKMLRVEAAPTGGVKAGDLCKVGDFVGVAANTVAEGKSGHEVSLLGVYRVKKAPGVAMNQGDKLYGAATNGKYDAVNKTASARDFTGWVMKDAAADAVLVEMLMPLGGYSEM